MEIFIEKPSYVQCMEFKARRESIIDLLMSLHVSVCCYECFVDWQMMFNTGLREDLMLA